MSADFASLEASIHYRFRQVKLLAQALTHSSYANEQLEPCPDNERLEYLGDAVLELCVSEEAFRRYPEAAEGQLTKVRSRLVKERSLAQIARELSLDTCLLLGRGEDSQGGRRRDALLADALEAVCGAVFLDGGFEAARDFVGRLFADRWPERADVAGAKDYKSRLQELTQKHFRERPVYVLSGSYGPEHDKVFEVTLSLPGGEGFTAAGGSVKKAEQSAAQAAVEYLRAFAARHNEEPEEG
jgi:ribonuclease-3